MCTYTWTHTRVRLPHVRGFHCAVYTGSDGCQWPYVTLTRCDIFFGVRAGRIEFLAREGHPSASPQGEAVIFGRGGNKCQFAETAVCYHNKV